MTKQHIRDALRAQLQAALPQRLEHSRRACELLLRQPEFSRATSVMAFAGMQDEIDTRDLCARVLEEKKRLILPRPVWASRQLVAIEIHALDQIDWTLRVPAPVKGNQTPLAEIELVLVPGVAFDLSGNRLGRGAGFYDRFLALPDLKAILCGLALEGQIVPRIPAETWDRPVQMLVTELHVRHFAMP